MASILNVDKIRATGSTTDGLTIDSSGRVLTPGRPAFRAEKRTPNQTMSGAAKITFEHEVFDIGGVYDTSNSRFTAPVAGIYFFQATLRFVADNQTMDYAKHMLYKNGSNASDLFQMNIRADYMQNSHLNGSVLIQLSASDYIEIYAEMSGNNPSVHANASGIRTFFTGCLVG